MNAVRRVVALAVLTACTLTLDFSAHAQSRSSLRDLARELAGKIAAAVAPFDEVHLVEIDADSGNVTTGGLVESEIASILRARGVRLVDRADGATIVRVACSENLSDRVCAAEIRKDDLREVAVASRPRDASGEAPVPPAVAALEVRPVVAGRLPILDLTEVGTRLLVLDTAGLTLFERGEPGWKAISTVSISVTRPWPRDVRGRLQLDGGSFTAFLPGLSCRGAIEPFAASCAEGQEPWPIGLPNSRLTANYFTSPRVPPFFSAAPLGPEGSAGWVVAGVDGRLHVLNEAFGTRQTLPGLGDDLASVKTACGPGRQVIVALAGSDALRAYAVTDRELVPLTPPAMMPGPVTALWEVPGTPLVAVVAHNEVSGRYEAFYVGISCAR